MELSPEQLTGLMAIGFGLVRIAEAGINFAYKSLTGKKGLQSSVEKLETNHIPHLQEEIIIGFKSMTDAINRSQDCYERNTNRMCEKMDRMIEGIGEIKGMQHK